MKSIIFTSFSLLLLASGAQAQVPFTQLPDLGFGGSALDINDSGQIAGSVTTNALFHLEPAIWANATATPTTLPTGGLGGFANAINNAGTVAGVTFFTVGAGGDPTVWVNGSPLILPTLGEGGVATDVNDRGEVVGSVSVDGGSRPALWKDGTLHVLPLPTEFNRDGIFASANGINANGDIVGTASTQGNSVSLVWKAKQVYSAFLPSWIETRGVRITDSGDVLVGGYLSPNGTFSSAILRADGTGTGLPLPYEYAYVWPTAMNRNLTVTGYYRELGSLRLLPISYVDGAIQSLQVPAAALWTIPTNIGTDGTVTGYWSDGVSGTSYPVIWNIATETISTVSVSGEPGTTVNLSATVKKGARAIRGRAVEFQIKRQRVGQSRTGSNGQASVSYPIPADKQPGQEEVMASMGGGRYALAELSVLPTRTALSAANLTAKPAAAINFTGRLTRRRDSAAIANQTVRFVYGGRTYSAKTDGTGAYAISFRIPSTMRRGQSMVATLEFPASRMMRGSTAQATVTIN